MNTPHLPSASRTGTPRLSINRWTFRTTPIQEFLEVTASHEIDAVGLWRQDVDEIGVDALSRRVDDAGPARQHRVPRRFPHRLRRVRTRRVPRRQPSRDRRDRGTRCPDARDRRRRDGQEDKDIIGARARVARISPTLAPYAEERGVTLSLEPLHPMFTADRAVISTLDQALDIAEGTGSDAVGVIVDTYHVWWDPTLEQAISRAGRSGRLFSYQVCDWNLPLAAEPLFSRGYMGDGYIDFPAITRMVKDAGYTGDIEVEIFNEDVWATPAHEAIGIVRQRYEELVLPYA